MVPELLPVELALVLLVLAFCCNPRNASRDCCRPSTIFSKLSMIRRSISSATAINLGSLGSMWNVSALVLVGAVAVEAEAEEAEAEAEVEVERGANSASRSIITSMSTTRPFAHVRHEPDRDDCRGVMTKCSGVWICWLLAVAVGLTWLDLLRTGLVVMEWLVDGCFAFRQDREASRAASNTHAGF